MNRTKLLILTDWYLPAYKAGGPIKSISNFVNKFQSSFQIKIFTSNRDKTEANDTLNVEEDQWLENENHSVFYATNYRFIRKLITAVKQSESDILYLNSIFSFRFSILPLLLYKLGFISNIRAVIAPRGMLQEGALSLKSRKKKFFFIGVNVFKLYANCSFHATDETEKNDIIKHLKINPQKIFVIPNIPSLSDTIQSVPKDLNHLKLVFVARLSKKKNLALVIQSLKELNIKYNVQFDFYGPEEEGYLDSLIPEIKQLPSNIQCKYKGELTFKDVNKVLSEYHVYILPTKGENFGHSIFEALSAGLPVIISDKTPWRNLQKSKIGFDISLDDSKEFKNAIEYFTQMGQVEFDQWSHAARNFALTFYTSQQFETEYLNLFNVPQKIGLVSALPLNRYKGGISVFTENIFAHQNEFETKNINLIHLNTCVIPRTNDSTGKILWINFKNLFKFIRISGNIIKDQQIKILHINSSISLSVVKDVFLACWFKYIHKTKNIFHIHSGEVKSIFPKKWILKCFLLLQKLGVDQIIVLTEKIQSFLVDKGISHTKINVLSNFHAVYFDKKIILDSKSNIQIGFLGSLDENKGIRDLFIALSKLESYNWQLKLAGEFIDLTFKNELTNTEFYKKNESRIEFYGYIDDERKNIFFQNIDILALPSYSEGMSLSLLEALYYGTAIVTTNVGANQEHFSKICNLIEPGNITDLVNELELLITNPPLLNKRKDLSKKLSVNYTFTNFKNQLIPIYQNI